MGIKRFDHRTKVKTRSERQNLQAASQLCTKQVGTGEINQIIESLLKVKVQRITKTYQIEPKKKRTVFSIHSSKPSL